MLFRCVAAGTHGNVLGLEFDTDVLNQQSRPLFSESSNKALHVDADVQRPRLWINMTACLKVLYLLL